MLRLGCRCHFTSQSYFIVLDSLSVSVTILFVTLDTVVLFVLLTSDLDESPWLMGKQQKIL